MDNKKKIIKNNKNEAQQKIKKQKFEEEPEDDYSNNDENNGVVEENNKWSQFMLNNKLCSNITKIFKEPTNIQNKTLIYTNAKVDLIIQARTGEGKTLCYAIPVLNYIFNFYERAPDMQKKISPVALILVPTHELGVQVKNHIEMIIQENPKLYKKNGDEDEKKIFIYNIKVWQMFWGDLPKQSN